MTAPLLGILSAYALVVFWAWLLYEQRRRANVRRLTWQEEMARQAEAFRELERAIGLALVPAVRRAADSMREFAKAWANAQPIDGAYSP